jgi:ABC-2 type transport system permease protein
MSSIVSGLLYLRAKSLQNATLSRLRRLKEPKYLVGGIVGIAYLYFAFFRRAQISRGASGGAFGGVVSPELVATATLIGAAVLLGIFALCWIWPRERAALNFSEAEIAFLFPAPVSRRTLVHFRLVSAILRVLFTALVLSVFSVAWSFLPGNFAVRIVGWWIVFSAVTLHVVGSSFVITRLLDRGVPAWLRQLGALGAVAAAGFLLWSSLSVPPSQELDGVAGLLRYLREQVEMGPGSWVLLPTRWLIQPLFAFDLRSLLAALGPALLVLAVHYFWVLQVEVNFAEATIAKAEKRAAKIAAWREGKWRGRGEIKSRRAPFDLSKVARPELAFLWKNLLSTAEYLRPRTALIAAVVIGVGCTWLTNQSAYQGLQRTLSIFAFVMGLYLLVLGPQFARQDLRSDLLNADILKTYPLRGWQVVLGEILTPAAIITVLVWLLLLATALLFRPMRMAWLTPQLRMALAIGIALIAPLLCTLQLLVVNAAALLFPAWLQIGRQRGSPPGIEVMGQRILFLAGQFLVLVVALLPAALVASIVFFVTQWMFETALAIVLAALVVMAVLGGEAALAIAWLGRRFERFDLSAELRP